MKIAFTDRFFNEIVVQEGLLHAACVIIFYRDPYEKDLWVVPIRGDV